MPALKTPLLAASLLLAALANARDVPTNVKNFKTSILAQAKCNKPLATGFYSSDSEGASKSKQYNIKRLLQRSVVANKAL
jgi:hypothetical protein